MLLSECAVCDSKNLIFMKEPETCGFAEDMDKTITISFALIGKVFGS